MKRFWMGRMLLPVVLLGLVAGCGGGGDGEPGDEEGPNQPAVLEVDVEKLASLGTPLGRALDEGRVEIAPPSDWDVPPSRSDKALAWFKEAGADVPRIYVKGADYAGEVTDVGKDNLEQFRDEMAKAVKADKKRKDASPVQSVIIGTFYGIQYKSRVNYNDRILDRLFVVTVQGGREYTVELWTPRRSLDDYENHAYAVAAGLKFVKPGDDPEKPAADEPSEKPADPPEEKPADESPQT